MIAALLNSDLAKHYELEAVSTSAGRGGVSRCTAFPAALARLLWVFALRRPAAVHVHTASWNSFPRKRIVVALARSFRIPVILQVHGGGFLEYIRERPGRALAVRRALETSCRVIVLSEALRAPLEAMSVGAKVQVIPNAVEVPSLPTRGMDSARVVFAGRPVADKGIPELLRASRGIAARIPSFRLVIAGDDMGGALAREVRDLGLETSVELCGWLSHDALDRVYAGSSVFVLPSHVEAMPVALLEAMSHGLACVVTPVGAVPQIIADGENGVVVPVGDAHALESSIERLLADPHLRRRLGSSARETIQERYSMLTMISQIREVYAACGIGPPSAENSSCRP
jgi:glycosyltransferase involved in cell wall biosynthesis